MTPQDLELIASAYTDDDLRSADDEFIESLLKQQDVDDITELDVSALTPKQLDWLRDIRDRISE